MTQYLHGTAVLVAGMPGDEVVDRVAAVCHEQWRSWARFMLDHPEEWDRFTQLLDTDFADLSDSDKDADRHWAHLMLDAARGRLDCRSGNRPEPPGKNVRVGARCM